MLWVRTYKVPKLLYNAGAPTLRMGGVADPRDTLLLTCFTMLNLVVLRQTIAA